MKEKIYIENLNTLPQISQAFIDDLVGNNKTFDKALVLGLTGNLGAGKTTFIQSLAKTLGVKDVVQSPTFTIFKLYQTSHSVFKELIHMDAYRIESVSELEPLRFQELLNKPETLFCIEWPEKIAIALPAHYLLKFKTLSEDERELNITKIDKS